MSGKTLENADIANAGRPHDVVALVVSNPDDAWQMPDDPFVEAGCKVVRANDLDDASEKCTFFGPELLFVPLTVAGQPITRQIEQCLAAPNAPVVVVVASNDQINAAAEAMRAGAYDCLFRPFSNARLTKAIANAMKALPDRASLMAERVLPSPSRKSQDLASGVKSAAREESGLLAVSPQMRNMLDQATTIARSEAPVFISGEIGTGKGELARYIHNHSPRSSAPWIEIDCATLTREQFERDVLGSDEAAARAAGGTLYFDEICEMKSDVQPLLLNLIDRGAQPGRVPVHRFVASTRHDPREAIREGRLRADLFYRLHVAPIAVPSLRERKGDITFIARTKLAQFSAAEGRRFTGIDDDAVALLEAHHWPGNVRELFNVLWTAVLLHDGPRLTAADLPSDILAPHHLGAGASAYMTYSGTSSETSSLIGHTLAEIEQTIIEATIAAQGGSVPRAARVLDVSPSTIYRKREAWERKLQDR